MPCSPRTISLAELVAGKIVTADGKTVGRIVEVQVSAGPQYRVVGLDVGVRGWLYRLHVLYPFARLVGAQDKPRSVRWEDVDRFERFIVTLKPGCEPTG